MLRYTLGPALSTPIWVFRHHSRNSISQLHPSTRHRHPIESTIAGRESSVTALYRREGPTSFAPRLLSLASTRLSHSLFLLRKKKGVRRELHGGSRSPITNLPHLHYALQPDCDELACLILTSSKFVDFRKICRCDISALTAPRQRCGG